MKCFNNFPFDCNYLFFLLIAISIYSPKNVQCHVTKCCSNDLVLKIEVDLSFICEPPREQISWHAHNIPTNTPPESFSNCSTVHSLFKGIRNNIELSGCVDRDSDNHLVALSCSKVPKTSIYLFNKCCPLQQIYDHSERRCRENHESPDQFNSFFGETVVLLENKVPDCSENEVFVEYVSSIHEIRFEKKNVEVNGNILSSDKFCIEAMKDKSSNNSTINEKQVIVRSCRPRTVCNQIPCIRRCCKVDQIMHPHPKGERKCKNHPNKTNLSPIFHDIQLPLDNSQKPIKLEGTLKDTVLSF